MTYDVRRWLSTSVYTDAGAYTDFLRSLPDSVPELTRMVCGVIMHPSIYFTEPWAYLEEKYFGKISDYPARRFKNEDEIYITAAAMIAGILRLDGRGFDVRRDVTRRITVSCRHASVLFSAILKAKGIPCRCRAGYMDFGDSGEEFTEHWVNEYWDSKSQRWILVDADGYYEYEERFGYSQCDLPRRKFLSAGKVWLGLRRGTLSENVRMYIPDVLLNAATYLFMDFHALMNNEIFYSHQPLYLRDGLAALGEQKLRALDELAGLLENPDENIAALDALYRQNADFYVLTNNTQNVYHALFDKN